MSQQSPTTRPEPVADRRALIFAYYFPPHGGGGVQRTLKYVKYLPGEGFRSTVVTSSEHAYPLRDPHLMREIPPGTRVRRARTLPLQPVRWKVDALLRRLGLPTRAAAHIGWPDALVGWVPAAVWHGLQAVSQDRPDVLYSTSSPVSSHLAAWIVQRRTGIPWVADFRDAWTLNPQEDVLYAPFARASAALERRMLTDAAAIVVADESIHVQGVTTGDPRRIVIDNGVDPDDVVRPLQVANGEPSSRFILSHVGSLYGVRDGRAVMDALDRLAVSGTIDRDNFELRIVGHASVARNESDSAPPVSITYTGHVEHARAVEEMASATALLFLPTPRTRSPSAKIYEYLTLGRPILCIAGRDNLAWRLVEELGAGECAEPEDTDGVTQALSRLVARARLGELDVGEGVREEVLRRFSRVRLAARLAEVFRGAITSAGSARTGST